MNKPIISAIIPTHNRCEYLKGAIVSLQRQNLPEERYEIIAVDNNSTDDTSKVIEECNKSASMEVVYIKEPNIGLHNARHTDAKIAQGKILAYTDDDVICDPNWLSELIRPYSDQRVG